MNLSFPRLFFIKYFEISRLSTGEANIKVWFYKFFTELSILSIRFFWNCLLKILFSSFMSSFINSILAVAEEGSVSLSEANWSFRNELFGFLSAISVPENRSRIFFSYSSSFSKYYAMILFLRAFRYFDTFHVFWFTFAHNSWIFVAKMRKNTFFVTSRWIKLWFV